MEKVRLFLMVFTEDRYCQLVSGADPAQAVVGHYDEMDAMCPVIDPELSEDFVVTLYEVTGDVDEVHERLLQRMDESDHVGCDALHAELNPSRVPYRVRILMRSDGVEATLLPQRPDRTSA